MNSQEIVDYVMNTPYNTNPTILKQMIEANGGSSGGGTVNSINNILPDEHGNVEIGWNNLTDKPFYEHTDRVLIAQHYANRGFGGPFIGALPEYGTTSYDGYVLKVSALIPGDTYIAVVNGEEYIGVAERVEDTSCDNNEGIRLFDHGEYPTDFSDAPISLDSYSNSVYISFENQNSSYEVELYHIENTVKTIDPKFLPEHSHSWNDLADKPFGDESTGGDTLTWDGNTDGLICVPHPYNEGSKLYKLSDSVPNQTDFTEWSYITDWSEYDPGNASGGIEDITPDSNGVIDVSSNEIYIIPESAINQDYELSNFPEKGVYFVKDSFHYVKEFKITNYTGFPTIKTLDPKYLPSGAGGGSATTYIRRDGNKYYTADGELFDIVAAAKELKKLTIYNKNSSGETSVSSVTDYSFYIGEDCGDKYYQLLIGSSDRSYGITESEYNEIQAAWNEKFGITE